MYILAIDSATPVAGVALLNDNKLIREDFVNFKKTHSETLMPMVDKILRDCEIEIKDLAAIAVTIGPGSFTGLRIGLAAAKGLSLASAKPIIGISTLDVLAHNLAYTNSLVCPLLDARKQEVYTAFYDASELYPRRLTKDLACSPEELIERLKEKAAEMAKENIILLGDGFNPYSEFFRDALQERLRVPPPHLMLTRAAALGSLACLRWEQDDFDDALALRPVYVRLSEAEYRLGKGEL